MKINEVQSEITFPEMFMEMAEVASKKSKDPSTKVGAIIVRPDNTPVSFGYNGFPRGVPDNMEYLTDRETKYEVIIHAEENAIINSKEDLKGYSIYITHPPCSRCFAKIIQSGISKVYAKPGSPELMERFKKSFALTDWMAFESGVQVIYMKGNDNE